MEAMFKRVTGCISLTICTTFMSGEEAEVVELRCLLARARAFMLGLDIVVVAVVSCSSVEVGAI